MKKKKQKKTDAAGKYTRPAAGPGGSGPGISSGPYGGAQQLPALQTIPFQPLQIQQEPMQPLPLAPGCERGASRGTKERTPADPAGICGAAFERWCDNRMIETMRPQKYQAFSVGPLVAHIVARENEMVSAGPGTAPAGSAAANAALRTAVYGAG